ncbi:MAG: hypothetical protein COU11_00850 [Candidatus Harrisonbacteria bacterium CG10_big_fil_rev_8_21_14_0_10_49_15]|uniref:Uncharacterized protein n=1 Tax=Candidatus Harrisonbacteria bacterium CG10_big_fil_rev_8_21_14_0_10_49_15 TaxID=1974587 RepID=A0A2H0ULU2_9BACT|nr:MAG: hypothetical protein COU11_00850 [Candidatus Harrisonbacteria bacterium CG10_big_fil_rev_8_21_14_0_10_49_15]
MEQQRQQEQSEFVTKAELNKELEGLAGMMSRGFTAMNEKFDAMSEKFDAMIEVVRGIADRTESIESALRQDQTRLDRVEQKVGIDR